MLISPPHLKLSNPQNLVYKSNCHSKYEGEVPSQKIIFYLFLKENKKRK